MPLFGLFGGGGGACAASTSCGGAAAFAGVGARASGGGGGGCSGGGGVAWSGGNACGDMNSCCAGGGIQSQMQCGCPGCGSACCGGQCRSGGLAGGGAAAAQSPVASGPADIQTQIKQVIGMIQQIMARLTGGGAPTAPAPSPATGTAPAPAGAEAAPAGAQASQFEQRLLELVNQTRRGMGLPEVRWDDEMARLARRSAAAKTHTAAPEVLAPWGYSSPEEALNAWRQSPGHWSIITDPSFTRMGAGWVGDGAAMTFGTTQFPGYN